VYINFELHPWAIAQRLNSLCAARPECKGIGETLHVWDLRGHNADLTLLRPKLEEQLDRCEFGMIILDPAYKVLGNRDENANGDIARPIRVELEAALKKVYGEVVDVVATNVLTAELADGRRRNCRTRKRKWLAWACLLTD